METPREYTVDRPKIVPSRLVTCAECGSLMAREIQVNWYSRAKKRMIRQNMLVVEVGGLTIKLYVRGEIECACGEKLVWSG